MTRTAEGERADVLAWLDGEIAGCSAAMRTHTSKKDYRATGAMRLIREAVISIRQAIANGEHVREPADVPND